MNGQPKATTGKALAGSRKVIVIVGGGVAGSEAAALAARAGALVLVIDRAARPYGAVLERVPAWHFHAREAQIGRIDRNLQEPGVVFVPATRFGVDVAADALAALGVPTIVQARGAGDATTTTTPAGTLDACTLMHWFNRRGEQGYAGPQVVIPRTAAVVGDGILAIEAARALVFARVGDALAARGLDVGPHQLAEDGVTTRLARHGLTPDALGVARTTLHVSALDALLPAWVDAATRAAVIERLARLDLVDVTAAPLAAGAAELVVDAPPLGAPDEDAPDLLALVRPSAAHAALQARLVALRTGLATLDGRGEARALAAAIGDAVRQGLTPRVEAALAEAPCPPDAVVRVVAWAQARQHAVGFTGYIDWIYRAIAGEVR